MSIADPQGQRGQDPASSAGAPARGPARSPLEACPATPPGKLPRWVYWLGLAVLTAAGAGVRVAWLNHPMRYDESWTFLFYIMPRTLSAALVYSAPNNHILHTLLVAAASHLGGDSPAVLRIPALLAGVALIPATGHLARVLSGRRVAGLIAATFVAASSILVEYSVNARGYTMFCLAAVLLAERTVRIGHDVRPRGPWIGWVLIAAAGLLTIPVMIYPMIVLAVVLLLQALVGGDSAARRCALRRTIGALAASAVLAFLLYLPVFRATGMAATQDDAAARASALRVYSSGLYSMVANPMIAPGPFPEAAAGLPRVAAEALAEWTRDTVWIWPAVAGVGLVAAAVAGVRRGRVMYLLPAVLVVVLPVLVLAQRVVPFARLWLFALPLLLALAGCGLAELAGWARAGRLRDLAVAATLLAALAVNADAARRLFQPGRRILGECALVDARQIVTDALELADGQTSLAWDFQQPGWPSLTYYTVLLSRPSRGFVHYLLDAGCRRVLLAVPKTEKLQQVLDNRPELAAAYGPMVLWRSYPTGDVYVGLRRTPPSSRPWRWPPP